MRGLLRVAEVVAWWGVAVGVWTLTLSSTDVQDWAVAAACGLPVAVFTAAARRTLRATWRPDPRWSWWMAPLAVGVVADTGRLLALAARPGPVDGRLETAPLPAERGARARARQALAALLLTSTPGSYVLDTREPGDGDADGPALVVHRLVDGAPDLDRVVGR